MTTAGIPMIVAIILAFIVPMGLIIYFTLEEEKDSRKIDEFRTFWAEQKGKYCNKKED